MADRVGDGGSWENIAAKIRRHIKGAHHGNVQRSTWGAYWGGEGGASRVPQAQACTEASTSVSTGPQPRATRASSCCPMWVFPKLGVPSWGPYYKGILLFGVYVRGPVSLETPMSHFDVESEDPSRKRNRPATLSSQKPSLGSRGAGQPARAR